MYHIDQKLSMKCKVLWVKKMYWMQLYRICQMCNRHSFLCCGWLNTAWFLHTGTLWYNCLFFFFSFFFSWVSGWQYKTSFHLSGSDSWRGDITWRWRIQATFWYTEKQRLLLGFPNYTGSALGNSTGAFSNTCLHHVLPTGRSVSTLTH